MKISTNSVVELTYELEVDGQIVDRHGCGGCHDGGCGDGCEGHCGGHHDGECCHSKE